MSDALIETLKQALGREYSIERELGGGGMARVFLAEDKALARRVVLKVLPPEAAGSVSAERFKREVQLAARLQHPHIVPLLSAGEVGGTPYYTMPFIEGESLRARIAREHELPIVDAIRILREVADALAYAHGNNVVHRDIKPDNVLIADQHALVADFGVAKAILSAQAPTTSGGTDAVNITQLGVAIGTPAYMAPEQAAADPSVDHRADIYALGAVGYELLTGRRPFTGRTPHALLAAVMSAPAQPITELRASVPQALSQLIMRCLEKRPADRPQTAAEVLHELEAQSTPTATIVSPPALTRGRAWLVTSLVSIAALASAAGAIWTRRPPVTSSAGVISVLPFVPASPDTALTRLGRDLVVTMSANLDGVGAIRATDPLTTLGLIGKTTATTAATAASVAKKLGAGSYVSGSILREGSHVRVDFALHPTSGAEPLARGSVSAPFDSVSALSDSLTWSLLRQVWRRDRPPTPSVAAITTRSMPALRAYLEGERARGEGRFRDAIAAFNRAIEADSTFWLAYWRNVTTHQWMFFPADTVLQRFRAHVNELPELDQAVFEAGETKGVSNRIAAFHRVAERFPDAWHAWETSGDLMFHEGPTVGLPLDRARPDLERAVSLNPRLTEAWSHLMNVALFQGGPSSPAADSIKRLLRGMGYDVASAQSLGFGELQFIELIFRLSADSTAIHSALADSVVGGMRRARLSPALAVIFPTVPTMYPGGARAGIALSGRALREGLSARDADAHRNALELAWASRGEYDSAFALVERRARESRDPEVGLDLLRIAALAEFSGAAPGTFESRWSVASRTLPPLNAAGQAEAHWLRGALAAIRRDTATLSTATTALSQLAKSDAPLTRYLSRELKAFVAHTRGDKRGAADSLLAIELDMAETETVTFTIAIARSTVGQWLQSSGRSEEAAKLLLWHEGLLPSRSFFAAKAALQPLVLLERGRLAEARGEDAEARRLYAEFLQRFDMPMPPHRPLVTEAQAALQRLAKRGG